MSDIMRIAIVCLLGYALVGAIFLLIFSWTYGEKTMSDDESPSSYRDRYKDDAFRLRQAPRSLLSKGSKVVASDIQDPDTGEWRTVIRMSRIKFDEQAKGIFLMEYQKWGRMGESAAAAGVSPQTVRKALEDDEDFAEAMLLCENTYRDRLIGHHQDLLFNGTEKTSYDRNGGIVSTETVYPIRLIELELKKHDAGYRDKQEVAINHSGGVLVAPAEMTSIDDWEKRFSKAKDVTPTVSIPLGLSDAEEVDDPF